MSLALGAIVETIWEYGTMGINGVSAVVSMYLLMNRLIFSEEKQWKIIIMIILLLIVVYLLLKYLISR